MRDLAIHDDDLIVATHGRSIWILDDISRLRQLSGAAMREVVLFHPASAWRVYRSTWTDTPLPPDEPLASNPPAGAVIEFFLPRAARRPVSLEILDSQGAVVRRFRSDDAPEPTAAELARELIPQYWIKPARVLPSQAGVHRWVWDLRYAAPASTTRGYPISAVPMATPRGPEGPLALPGNYVVRLEVDGRHLEAPLTLKEDPREQLPPHALADQLHLARELSSLLTDSSRALLAATSEQAQLKALQATGAAAAAPVKTYAARLEELLGTTDNKADEAGKPAVQPKPSLTDLQDHLATLYTDVTRGDGAPTAAQKSATQSAQSALLPVLADWRKLESDLPDLNKRLRAAGLAPIRADIPPPRDLNVADQD
jgi:hypothetical protein